MGADRWTGTDGQMEIDGWGRGGGWMGWDRWVGLDGWIDGWEVNGWKIAGGLEWMDGNGQMGMDG